ncbi:plasmid recombination protein [Clostridium sp. SYSU_GA19001]|uniref:plasmid recombination protein n=1 Tax=Clostridium caldaquaticum TaxID=2940653 RepID=UPI0020775E3E|nr:plasmid recombination protein [Clostridium caldaquaticum]MCM8710558.1 plasmid recombination protein [Clostridium caldaquaticum]
MVWEDVENKEEKLYKEPTYRSINSNYFYCILRFGKKHKAMISIRGFQKHMQREIDVPNADTKIPNEILIGDNNVYDKVINYIKDVKLRSNNVIAREILLTASPGFFKGLSNIQLEQWKTINKEWLQNNFKDNCIYAVLHKDESTWHIHALIIPKFYSEKKQSYILSNARYFDGVDKLRTWQDNYASSMQSTFKSLNRGIKYSKAKHIEVRKWYTLINEQLNEKDLEQVKAKALNNELVELKLKSIQNTLKIYKKYNIDIILENEKLNKELKELKKDKNYFENAVKLISNYYKIDEKKIKQLINYNENTLGR